MARMRGLPDARDRHTSTASTMINTNFPKTVNDQDFIPKSKQKTLASRNLLGNVLDSDDEASILVPRTAKRNMSLAPANRFRFSDHLAQSPRLSRETLPRDPLRQIGMSPRKAAMQIVAARRQRDNDMNLSEDSSEDSDPSDEDIPSPATSLKCLNSTKQSGARKPRATDDQQLDLAAHLEGLRIFEDTNKSSGSDEQAPETLITKTNAYKHSLQTTLDKENMGPCHHGQQNSQQAIKRLSTPSHSPLPPLRPMTSSSQTNGSPLKTKLQSPTKNRKQIPLSSVSQDADAFWDADQVNAWNDIHSPRKPLKSLQLEFSEELVPVSIPFPDSTSPSPPLDMPDTEAKPQTKPYTKPSKAEIAARKAFDAEKQSIAQNFLAELDSKVTGGQIGTRTASTGGTKIVWSKTLNKTAGRASTKRRPALPPPDNTDGDPAAPKDPDAFEAKIELASKVLTDRSRLYNTLAHEFCHVADRIMSRERGKPHGKGFKMWARRCEAHFGASHSIKITTRHSYAIAYKFAWECAACKVVFQRHSRSIDVGHKVCGRCSGKLVQIRPKPRAKASSPAKPRAQGHVETIGQVQQSIKMDDSSLKCGNMHKTPVIDLTGDDEDAATELCETDDESDEDDVVDLTTDDDDVENVSSDADGVEGMQNLKLGPP